MYQKTRKKEIAVGRYKINEVMGFIQSGHK